MPVFRSAIDLHTAWEEAYNNARGALGHPVDGPIPEVPKIAPADRDVAMDESSESGGEKGGQDMARAAAAAAASIVPFLTTADLMPPKMPTREEMEGILLALRKKALVEEYFG
jgi:pre-mRNA-splicing factor ISY1